MNDCFSSGKFLYETILTLQSYYEWNSDKILKKTLVIGPTVAYVAQQVGLRW